MKNTPRQKLIQYARQHRNSSTKAEIRLWCEILRKRGLKGFACKRQAIIGPYIFDFYIPELELVIEVDGRSHFTFPETTENDKKKERFATENNLALLRFSDDQVMDRIEHVRFVLEDFAEKKRENI